MKARTRSVAPSMRLDQLGLCLTPRRTSTRSQVAPRGATTVMAWSSTGSTGLGLHRRLPPPLRQSFAQTASLISTRFSPLLVYNEACQMFGPRCPYSSYGLRSTAAEGPVWASVVLDEGALSNWRDVETWLDTLTTFDVDGFYIIVSRTRRSYPGVWTPDRLTNYLRMVYSLAVLNGYEVLAGYSDFEGVAALAAGATGHATGWFYSLRQFVEGKWQPSKGGRAAAPRVTSTRVWTPFVAEGEAEQIAASTRANQLFPPERVRRLLRDNPDAWSLANSWDQHLSSVSGLSSRVSEFQNPSERANEIQRRLDIAHGELNRLRREGLVLPAEYTTRLEVFRQALEELRDVEDF